jgi:hypothetical protein
MPLPSVETQVKVASEGKYKFVDFLPFTQTVCRPFMNLTTDHTDSRRPIRRILLRHTKQAAPQQLGHAGPVPILRVHLGAADGSRADARY